MNLEQVSKFMPIEQGDDEMTFREHKFYFDEKLNPSIITDRGLIALITLIGMNCHDPEGTTYTSYDETLPIREELDAVMFNTSLRFVAYDLKIEDRIESYRLALILGGLVLEKIDKMKKAGTLGNVVRSLESGERVVLDGAIDTRNITSLLKRINGKREESWQKIYDYLFQQTMPKIGD